MHRRRLTSAVPLKHSASRSVAFERESGGMRVPWKRLTWLLVAAVPVAAVAGVVRGGTRHLSRLQARLAQQVRKGTGRELAALAPLFVKLGRQAAMLADTATHSHVP